jgi:hypothetical protein
MQTDMAWALVGAVAAVATLRRWRNRSVAKVYPVHIDRSLA